MSLLPPALAYLQWNADPILIDVGPLTIRWYGLLFALGFFLGFLLMRHFFRREGKPEKDLDPLLLAMLLGTIIGARLGHILFYDPSYYLMNPVEIIKIWRGGLASHGGVLGILIAVYIYSRPRADQPYIWLLDRLAIPTALAASFIRIGNFFNSEILGNPTDVPWAVIFQRIDQVPRHPVQLYESITYLAIFGMLWYIYRQQGAAITRGFLSGLFLILVFGSRFFLEYFKMAQAAFAEQLPLSMGQLLSIPLVLVGIGLILYSHRQDLS